MEYSKEDLSFLEKQLSCPEGEAGIALGADMHAGNISMTRATWEKLPLAESERILELGHGAGMHIEELLGKATVAEYTGLEVSKTMWAEARRNVAAHDRCSFLTYDGLTLPSEVGFFDLIFTVNTVYFWQDPRSILEQLWGCCLSRGRLAITFADAEFMSSLPFVKERFKMYTPEVLGQMAIAAGWELFEHTTHVEQAISKTGAARTRTFYCMYFIKP